MHIASYWCGAVNSDITGACLGHQRRATSTSPLACRAQRLCMRRQAKDVVSYKILPAFSCYHRF